MSRIQFGTYWPAYWRIRITGCVNLSRLTDLKPEDLALYVHEYTHFLQEITSTSGLNFTWNILDRFRQILAAVQHGGDEINLPLKGPTVDEQLNYFRALRPVIGSRELDHDNGTYTVRSVTLPPNRLIEELTDGHKIPEVHLALENREGRQREYIFGSDAIQESMAQLLEQRIDGHHATGQFPYIAAKRLAEYLCPAVAGKSEFLFAACDAALMSPYPGWHFYQLLMEMERTRAMPERAEEIYRFAFALFERDHWMVLESYEKAVESLSHVVAELFGDRPEFHPTKTWFIHVLRSAFQLRRDNPYLMLDLYRDKIFGPALNWVVEEVGFPEVMNGCNERWFSAPLALKGLEAGIEPIHLWAIWQIHDLLLQGIPPVNCLLSETGLHNSFARKQSWQKMNWSGSRCL